MEDADDQEGSDLMSELMMEVRVASVVCCLLRSPWPLRHMSNPLLSDQAVKMHVGAQFHVQCRRRWLNAVGVSVERSWYGVHVNMDLLFLNLRDT